MSYFEVITVKKCALKKWSGLPKKMEMSPHRMLRITRRRSRISGEIHIRDDEKLERWQFQSSFAEMETRPIMTILHTLEDQKGELLNGDNFMIQLERIDAQTHGLGRPNAAGNSNNLRRIKSKMQAAYRQNVEKKAIRDGKGVT
jgi:hypothetical protein